MEDKKDVKEEVKKTKKEDPKDLKKDSKSTKTKEAKEAKKETKKETKKDSKKSSSKEKVQEKTEKVKKDNKAEPKEKSKKDKTKKEEKNKSKNLANKETEKENDLTFKRVEVKEEKKNHRLLKFILILVIILIGAYCVFFSRNFIILNSIYNQMCEIGSSTNYSYEMIKKQDGEEILKMTYYKKDNVERVDLEDKNNNINTITDLDSNQVTTWNPKDKTASIYNTEVTTKVRLPLEESINNQESRAFMGLTSIIYTEECNSKECYVILQICSPNMMNSSQKTWLDKETGLVVKREYLNCTVEYNNVEMNNVRNIDTPDLRTYKVDKEN